MDTPEARIIETGQPIDTAEAAFEGSLAEARARVDAMGADERARVSIWTPGHMFTADELLAEQPGHEHDPLDPDRRPLP